MRDKTRETERERLKETDGRLKREEKTAGSKGGRGGRADGEMGLTAKECGNIGVIINASKCGASIGPPADSE